ncbi:potassium-transporting ATPase subunit KdpB [Commensalibacter oyaizuii]|uniref:Potassium-transporting ATPase ATP-binding subunit n=1 Tax=Commensalibacter oyaizuii TaxID=3043873 RepID=A0ABT6PZ19_9PROT|nr:potassium-transporting ATPase subunit KdpB [Commensalibacter sp. TBRC 16381]MDI2090097.1 potassium-transporting ATPase subunit KdpB [Commensalibacter sp. TBRC 16381]
MLQQNKLLTAQSVKAACKNAFLKLNPLVQIHNPVMFIVYICSIFSIFLSLHSVIIHSEQTGFIISITIWLWFTLLFANFAEAIAEGQSKAQADALKGLKQTIQATRLSAPHKDAKCEVIVSNLLRQGDIILVNAGEIIPADGEVIEGVASVDESAITGESAPVIRESGGDFCSVTGGTKIISDYLIIRVMANPGESFLDKMIGMVEGAERQKTPNEIALTILLVTLSLIFLVVIIALFPFTFFSVEHAGAGHLISLTALIALLVCLIPTTIGGLLSAIGVAGMSRMMQSNVIATSGRAVETAGNIDVLLLDKTGTITYGNRQASDFYPAPRYQLSDIAKQSLLASKADDTPEGRSIVVLAEKILKEHHIDQNSEKENTTYTPIPFTAQTRMSGVDITSARGTVFLRKGAANTIKRYVEDQGGQFPQAIHNQVNKIASEGATPLVVALDDQVIGCIALRDIVKPNIRERFSELRSMGIKTVMITGDNALTAAAIASDAGVDDYLSDATPENKLALIRNYQQQGLLVAMTGDGTNDAPALAQADVAVAMNSGTQAAKEASNMVDLDSDPTKLIEIVKTGKQLLMTRGALTTFSIANDIAKYFAVIPAAFSTVFPALGILNIMQLHSPESAILSATIFNALIIITLIPLALKGVQYRAVSAIQLLRKNLLIYGLGGIIVPFVCIKLIDMCLAVI